ncbi:hypothetical protein MLD38_024376 [Melastoma candidum]|uniref:Uncharacterized protein n=1 Tax=Melastoma candidum TaxID=119954 RepID=A0ACB9NVG9_9MYRT|nr:hypothetical protein MLD38_024376 [Melastoma candidum]
MKDRGKGIAAQLALNDFDPETIPCRDHPRSSNVGVCAHCLKDRLLNLVCSECGEQRLSSCSCSDDLSSNRNSCAHDVASLGRVSFLLDNEKQGDGQSVAGLGPPNSFGPEKPEEVVVLRRSSSSCTEGRQSGIWRVGKLFLRGMTKKKQKKRSEEDRSGGDQQGQSERWAFDEDPVSRSRSLHSFRGGENWNFSAAQSSSSNGNPSLVELDRKSCFSEAEMRRSGFSETEMRKSCFSETDARKSLVLEGGVFETGMGNMDVPRLNRRIFSLRESDYFSRMDERNFIDLRFCSATESRAEDWRGKGPATGEGGELLRSGSCRVTSREGKGMRKSKSFMGLKWGVFRHHHQTQTQIQLQHRQQNPKM